MAAFARFARAYSRQPPDVKAGVWYLGSTITIGGAFGAMCGWAEGAECGPTRPRRFGNTAVNMTLCTLGYAAAGPVMVPIVVIELLSSCIGPP